MFRRNRQLEQNGKFNTYTEVIKRCIISRFTEQERRYIVLNAFVGLLVIERIFRISRSGINIEQSVVGIEGHEPSYFLRLEVIFLIECLSIDAPSDFGMCHKVEAPFEFLLTTITDFLFGFELVIRHIEEVVIKAVVDTGGSTLRFGLGNAIKCVREFRSGKKIETPPLSSDKEWYIEVHGMRQILTVVNVHVHFKGISLSIKHVDFGIDDRLIANIKVVRASEASSEEEVVMENTVSHAQFRIDSGRNGLALDRVDKIGIADVGIEGHIMLCFGIEARKREPHYRV